MYYSVFLLLPVITTYASALTFTNRLKSLPLPPRAPGREQPPCQTPLNWLVFVNGLLECARPQGRTCTAGESSLLNAITCGAFTAEGSHLLCLKEHRAKDLLDSWLFRRPAASSWASPPHWFELGFSHLWHDAHSHPHPKRHKYIRKEWMWKNEPIK